MHPPLLGIVCPARGAGQALNLTKHQWLPDQRLQQNTGTAESGILFLHGQGEHVRSRRLCRGGTAGARFGHVCWCPKDSPGGGALLGMWGVVFL